MIVIAMVMSSYCKNKFVAKIYCFTKFLLLNELVYTNIVGDNFSLNFINDDIKYVSVFFFVF